MWRQASRPAATDSRASSAERMPRSTAPPNTSTPPGTPTARWLLRGARSPVTAPAGAQGRGRVPQAAGLSGACRPSRQAACSAVRQQRGPQAKRSLPLARAQHLINCVTLALTHARTWRDPAVGGGVVHLQQLLSLAQAVGVGAPAHGDAAVPHRREGAVGARLGRRAGWLQRLRRALRVGNGCWHPRAPVLRTCAACRQLRLTHTRLAWLCGSGRSTLAQHTSARPLPPSTMKPLHPMEAGRRAAACLHGARPRVNLHQIRQVPAGCREGDIGQAGRAATRGGRLSTRAAGGA